MRAIYLPNTEISNNSTFKVEGEDFHHLINVLRIKENQEILVLNGTGIKTFSIIDSIEKKQLSIKVNKLEQTSRKIHYSLGLCVPKKEYFEDAVRIAIELGISDLHLFESEYSQRHQVNEKRLQKILKSSYEQSNNPFEIKVHEPVGLNTESLKAFENIYFFNSQSDTQKFKTSGSKSGGLILIGPEGGFSPSEVALIQGLDHAVEISLKEKPIMRSVTAIPFAFGYLMH